MIPAPGVGGNAERAGRVDVARRLLHPGFAKAGSTFLQEWFERDPRFCFTAHGIAGFGNVFQIADQAHEHPNREYRYFVTSNELLGSGGRIPYGCLLFSFDMLRNADFRQGQRDICRMLRDILPGARVLIVTRGFRGIIRSLYSQYVKMAGKSDFPTFLERYSSILVQWLDVDYNLRVYREAFGDDNVIVLPFELLKADSKLFLETIENELGLDHAAEVPGARNETLGPDEMYWYSLLSRYVVSPLADRFGPWNAGRIYSFYGFKVVERGRLSGFIRLMNRILPRAADLTFPDGYLDRFRGMADSLAAEKVYEPYLSEYLLSQAAPGDVPGDRTAFERLAR